MSLSLMNLPFANLARVFPSLPFPAVVLLFLFLLLSYTSRVQATAPDISGTYSGTLSGSEFSCTNPADDGPIPPFSITITISQSNSSFSGTASFVDSDGPGSATLSSGTVLSSGAFSGNVSGTGGDGGNFAGSFNGMFSNDSISLNINVSDLGPPGCDISLSGTLSRVSGGDLIVNPAITPSNVLTGPLLLNTHVKAVTSDLNNRIADVLKGFGSGVRNTSSGLMYQESGLNAGDSVINYGIWGSYSYSDFENDFISTAFDGHRHNVLAGFDISPWENTVLGIAAGYDFSDIDTRFNQGNQESDGFTIAPYAGLLLSENWSVDAAIGYSRVGYDQYRTDPGTGARITSSPDATRWFGTLNVNGFTTWNNWIIGGRIGMLHARNIQQSFFESNGTFVPEFVSKLGQWNVGGDVAYSFDEFEPFARIAYEHDYSMTEIAVVGGGPQPSNDNDNFVFGAGIRYFGRNGLTGNLEWNKRVDREDFNEDIFSITVRMDF